MHVAPRSVEIVSVHGHALVEDGGRAGRLSEAIPRGGALDPEALAVANVAVGNDASAAAIERYGALELEARGVVRLADEHGRVVRLAAGERARLAWDGARRVGYVALDGGVDVPPFLGGRGTMLSLGAGGHEGRMLRRGDVIALGPPGAARPPRATPIDDGPIRVTRGPDLARLSDDALALLLSTAWTLDPRSDRSGTRLSGPVVPHRDGARAITTPMIEGAIECPPSSAPIVLGPEHPTTGGYPVVAVVARVDLARFHRVPLGRPVRFVEVSAREAREATRR